MFGNGFDQVGPAQPGIRNGHAHASLVGAPSFLCLLVIHLAQLRGKRVGQCLEERVVEGDDALRRPSVVDQWLSFLVGPAQGGFPLHLRFVRRVQREEAR